MAEFKTRYRVWRGDGWNTDEPERPTPEQRAERSLRDRIERLGERNKALTEALDAIRAPLQEAARTGSLPGWTTFEALAAAAHDALVGGVRASEESSE